MMPLHVALDAREASDPVHGTGTGVGRYVYNLLQHLPAADPAIRYTAFVRPAAPPARPEAGGRLQEVRLPPYPGAAHWALPAAARLQRANLLHGPANILPLMPLGLPGVLTVHDLAIYRHPDFFPGGQGLSTRVLVPRALRRAARIICPSQYTADEVRALFGIPPERLRVIPHGVEGVFAQPPAVHTLEAARSRYALPARYVLFVGTLQPRKNLEMALRAVAAVRRDAPVELVVAGGRGWGHEATLRLIPALDLGEAVRLLGYVPVHHLPALYAQAEALLFPSRYEGFGLPVLEAMACGIPVLAADRTSLPEVAGKAALLLDPEDAPGWARALRSVLEDGELRSRLIAAGREHSRRFRWEAAAAAHVEVYREAAGR